jgi:hypothetical protein
MEPIEAVSDSCREKNALKDNVGSKLGHRPVAEAEVREQCHDSVVVSRKKHHLELRETLRALLEAAG